MSVRPFSPEEARRIVQNLQQPAVFPNMTRDWPALRWTAEHLSARLGPRPVRFRLGRKQENNTPLFETQCSYVEAEVSQFLSWTRGQTEAGPFSEYPPSEYWAYADYKYIAQLFEDQPSMFEDVRWSEFGFEGRNGRESTLWMGTQGANTPCHMDSYGCNLVLQVQGRKRWHLFPPEDASGLYPTRIPYEESSVFSRVDVLRPDLSRFPAFQRANAHLVTLQPGQVLFVPRHWWHYVESVDPVTVSINSWIELEADGVERVKEAVTRTIVCAIKGAASAENNDVWLNPTEEGRPPHDENMAYLNLALGACGGGGGPPTPQTGLQGPHEGPGPPVPAPLWTGSGPRVLPGARTTEEDPHRPRGGPGGLQGPGRWTQGTCRSRGSRGLGGLGALGGPALSTNGLLDCLLHPDVISRVTELLLDRNGGPRES
ncbi:HSPB1-associated protein 1 homolog [Menidia menidia]